ncbi:MAG: hypothetical protein EA362_04880 [Saprospirales bacterium]|nr:MAG: hypothetical protein EA362_04880 [Saprospirales bacterium]
MKSANNQYFGIWLDDNKALIITLDVDKTLIIPVFRKKSNLRNSDLMIKTESSLTKTHRYYNDIFSVLPKSETVLILGPDQHKLHLKEFLEKESDEIIHIITKVAGHMTTSDIISTVRSHFFGEKVGAISV